MRVRGSSAAAMGMIVPAKTSEVFHTGVLSFAVCSLGFEVRSLDHPPLGTHRATLSPIATTNFPEGYSSKARASQRSASSMS